MDPRVSPDGRRIAFTVGSGLEHEAWAVGELFAERKIGREVTLEPGGDMAELFPSETQLFEVYVATFEVLMKCLLISVIVLFVATLILIALCCWETVQKPRERS